VERRNKDTEGEHDGVSRFMCKAISNGCASLHVDNTSAEKDLERCGYFGSGSCINFGAAGTPANPETPLFRTFKSAVTECSKPLPDGSILRPRTTDGDDSQAQAMLLAYRAGSGDVNATTQRNLQKLSATVEELGPEPEAKPYPIKPCVVTTAVLVRKIDKTKSKVKQIKVEQIISPFSRKRGATGVHKTHAPKSRRNYTR
jgi:hypothetical protein